MLPHPKDNFGKLHGTVAPTIDVFQSFYHHLNFLPNSCSLCLSAEETNKHLFFHCPFSWGLWGNLFKLLYLSRVIPDKLLDFLFSPGGCLYQERHQGVFGSYAYMLDLDNLEGAQQTSIRKSLGDPSLVWDSILFFFCRQLGKKDILILVFLSSLSNIIFGRFSFLMRMTLFLLIKLLSCCNEE